MVVDFPSEDLELPEVSETTATRINKIMQVPSCPESTPGARPNIYLR